MDECEVCLKPDSKFHVVISPRLELLLCSDCMNLYGNHDYDKLIEKLHEKK